MTSSRNKFVLLQQNPVTDVSVGFRAPCCSSFRRAPAWRLHTNHYKFGLNISSDISYMKCSSDLNLGEGLCMFTSFHFPDSGLYLLNGFDFFKIYFKWRDTENQQLRNSEALTFLSRATFLLKSLHFSDFSFFSFNHSSSSMRDYYDNYMTPSLLFI